MRRRYCAKEFCLIHHTEDEIFHLLEGEFRFQVGHKERRCQAGAVLLAPKGIPHTYRVESSMGGDGSR